MGALICISALGAGNFIYQAVFQDPNWSVALGVSIHQAVAIGVYVLFWQK